MLEIENLTKTYTVRNRRLLDTKKFVKPLDNLSVSIPLNKCTGIVGESGSGKTTLARVLTGIINPDTGDFSYNSFRLSEMGAKEWKDYRRKVQMVFQDPYSSLNPRLNVQQILQEPLKIHRKTLQIDKQEMEERVGNILEEVGLKRSDAEKYPHEFSGGQRQRIGIARALILQPELLILDEAVSALDVSIQAQILNLLKNLQETHKLTFLFIAHDLSVVGYLSDYIAVMYKGQIVEYNLQKEIFANPKHPYTKLLLDSVPGKGGDRTKGVSSTDETDISEEIPENTCAFLPRCGVSGEKCSENPPPLTTDREGFYRCYYPLQQGKIEEKTGKGADD